MALRRGSMMSAALVFVLFGLVNCDGAAEVYQDALAEEEEACPAGDEECSSLSLRQFRGELRSVEVQAHTQEAVASEEVQAKATEGQAKDEEAVIGKEEQAEKATEMQAQDEEAVADEEAQAEKSMESDEMVAESEWGPCDCKAQWSYWGTTYKSCTNTSDHAHHDHKWCYVRGGDKCKAAKAGFGGAWKYCDSCECKTTWSYLGKHYHGCSKTPDHDKHWCYVQDGSPKCASAHYGWGGHYRFC